MTEAYNIPPDIQLKNDIIELQSLNREITKLVMVINNMTIWGLPHPAQILVRDANQLLSRAFEITVQEIKNLEAEMRGLIDQMEAREFDIYEVEEASE